jgi:hypothetical protein
MERMKDKWYNIFAWPCAMCRRSLESHGRLLNQPRVERAAAAAAPQLLYRYHYAHTPKHVGFLGVIFNILYSILYLIYCRGSLLLFVGLNPKGPHISKMQDLCDYCIVASNTVTFGVTRLTTGEIQVLLGKLLEGTIYILFFALRLC